MNKTWISFALWKLLANDIPATSSIKVNPSSFYWSIPDQISLTMKIQVEFPFWLYDTPNFFTYKIFFQFGQRLLLELELPER